MALKLNERYPGRWNNPSSGYPQGSFKNRTSPSAKDGSYLESDWANDKEGFFQSLLSRLGITPNGAVDQVNSSQYFDAMLLSSQKQLGTAFNSVGGPDAFTIYPNPPVSSYSSGQRFRVAFNVAGGATPALGFSGLAAKSLKQYGASGEKVPAVIASGQRTDVEYDGVDMVVLDPLPTITQATETVVGGAFIAAQSTVNAGANDTTIITPLKLFGWVSSGVSAASETARGFIKLATQTLVNSGLDDNTAITPKKLFAWVASGVSTATEAVYGFLKVAPQSLTDSGTDDASIVTPKKLRGGASWLLATNGYLKLPSWLGGIIINWGRVTVGYDAGTTVNFSMNYTSSIFAAFASVNTSTTTPNGSYSAYANAISNSQITISNDGNVSSGSTSQLISWLTIGN